MAGVGNKTLKELGRWKRVEMSGSYVHLSQEHVGQALERIDSGELNSLTVFATIANLGVKKVGAK